MLFLNTQSRIIFGLLAVLDVIAAIAIARKLNRHLYISLFTVSGGRDDLQSAGSRYVRLLRDSAAAFRLKGEKTGLYVRISEKLKKSGYTGENAALVYLLFKYPLTILLGIAAYVK
jgi:hypothetical protein